MILKGNNLIIKLNGVAIAASKSCSINVQAKMIEVSSPTDGQWEHSIAGRKSWSVSTSHLMVADNAQSHPLKDAIGRVGQSYTLSFECRDLSGDTMSGTAICKSFKTTATRGNLLTGGYDFEGSGPLQ